MTGQLIRLVCTERFVGLELQAQSSTDSALVDYAATQL